MRSAALQEQERLKEIAVANYALGNIGRLNGREQTSHFLSISQWYFNSVGAILSDLHKCRRALAGYRNTTLALVSTLQSSGLGFLVSGPGGEGKREAPDMCSPDPAAWAHPLPERERFGRYLGPWGLATGWILATESVPLVLIVGLVGFGLFGALVSSFIRAREREGPTDLFAVICIGGSAAIVIFLAAYGGIVVMTQSEHDPNAYVLFVTCLVAAVFGEDVWRWARRRFVPQEEDANPKILGPSKDATPAQAESEPTGETAGR